MTTAPLIMEPHPADYTGYRFITLVQHRQDTVLAIIDNISATELTAYVLDLCQPSEVNEEEIIKVAAEWFVDYHDKYPISIEFSKRGMGNQTSRIHKTFALDSVTRIIGPVFYFPMKSTKSVKRKKKKV